ncbi:glycosyltransferase [Candidatus Uhrbacteria bacterium]|nr:glycosyltransferase [Candidatus Uhrbacteria bacterium]
MKIFYAVNARLPTEKAHGIQIMSMCSALAEQGHEVLLVSPRRWGNGGDPFSAYGFKQTFKWQTLPVIDFLSRFPNIFTLALEGLSFAAGALLASRRARADILYLRDEWLALIFSLFQKPFILELHRLPSYGKWLRFINAKSLVVATTAALAQDAKPFLRSGARIIVAHDGADLRRFSSSLSQEEARKKLSLPVEAKIAMYVGRLEAMGMEKGIYLMLEAFGQAYKNGNKNIVLAIVGGPESAIAAYKQYLNDLGLPSGAVIFAGQRPYAEIPDWLAAADALLMPTPASSAFFLRWTSPLKLFEYLASGRPVIATDLPSVREVVNAESACLVPAGDAAAMGRALRLLLDNEDLRRRYGGAGRAIAEKYSWLSRGRYIIGEWAKSST